MYKFILRKALQMLLMLLGISFLIYTALNNTGVDPIFYLVDMNQGFDPEELEKLREFYGLNRPFIVRYWDWLCRAVQGDFGKSLVAGVEVNHIVSVKLPATLEVTMIALCVSAVLGVILGMICAVWQNGILDYICRFIAVVGNSVPAYFVGLVLLQVFAIKLGWFPSYGRSSPGDVTFFDRIEYIILPVACLVIGMCGAVMRYTRNNMLDTANKDFIKTARSKGVSEWKVYTKHVFRNSMRPVMMLVVMRLGALMSYSVAVDMVFSWPGIGPEFTNSIIKSDYNVVMALTLMVALVVLVCSLLIDIFTALLDPRVRLDK